MQTFDEGTTQDWMDVIHGVKKFWKQNSVNTPMDCATTLVAILKGDSLSTFETALLWINNSLPYFPEGNPKTKYSESELVGLLEWALPTTNE